MSGEKDLYTLLQNLSPVISFERFVFSFIANDSTLDWTSIHPLGSFLEAEGRTVIVQKELADTHNIPYTGVFRCITLQVHSSLEAVGLTAFVSNALAKENIPANVIAAYHHDHIFVPESKADRALEILSYTPKTQPKD